MAFPLVGLKASGFRTFFGTWVAPGSNVTFLGPPGVFDGFAENARVSTLASAAARSRASKNDLIFALPGYAENVSAAAFASIPAGTKLIGLGVPGEGSAPKLTWTAATSTLPLNAADILIQNMTLDFAGVADCAAPITVSAAGCAIENCRIVMQNDTPSFSALSGITLAAGAHRFRLNTNTFVADSEDDDANVTGGCLNIGAAVIGVEVKDNRFTFACPGDTVGIVDVTAAAKQLDISDNLFYQLATNAAFCIILDNVAAQGFVVRNRMRVTEDVAPASAGLLVGAAALILNSGNLVSASSTADATLVDAVDA
jgi:hypothetical protein